MYCFYFGFATIMHSFFKSDVIHGELHIYWSKFYACDEKGFSAPLTIAREKPTLNPPHLRWS